MIRSCARYLGKNSFTRSVNFRQFESGLCTGLRLKRQFSTNAVKDAEVTDEALVNDLEQLKHQSVKFQLVQEPYQRRVGIWLILCAGTIFGMIILGGYTRLSRSGLSMTKWKPIQNVYPRSQEAWQAEFEHYKVADIDPSYFLSTNFESRRSNFPSLNAFSTSSTVIDSLAMWLDLCSDYQWFISGPEVTSNPKWKRGC